MRILGGQLAVRYILKELLPVFLMGIVTFIFIILMFQSFRLMEYVIVHGASLKSISQILFYMTISFLPIVLPMSLLFGVLLTYGQLGNDSEIIALKAVGYSMKVIALPAFLLAIAVTILSVFTTMQWAPWGNRQMEVLIHKMGEIKPVMVLKEGVFSEGFFDLVVYANKVHSKTGLLEKIFIYDERNPDAPLTIIAKSGKLIQETGTPGHKAFLRLFDGNIHKDANGTYTKISYKSYDIQFYDPVALTRKKKSNLSLNFEDLKHRLAQTNISPKDRKRYVTEVHRRWATSIVCLIFALIGVSLGGFGNKRSGKSSGFVLSVSLAVGYWVLYGVFEGIAKNDYIPVALAIWTPNIIYLTIAVLLYKKAHNN